MIILPIEGSKQDNDDDTPLEWSLLELNGELLPSKAAPEGDEMELGKVIFDSEGSAKMTIASHELKGKVQKLKQPFVIMKPFKRDRNDVENMVIDDSNSSCKRQKSNGYTIAGIVRTKILFDQYPKSIMK